MYAKLTYSSLLACIACIATACGSDAIDNAQPQHGPEVSFDVSGMTRASSTPTINHFAVYGDMKFPVDKNTVPTIIFNKTEVVYNNGAWRYDGTQYWFPKHEHSFVAISPVAVLDAPSNPQYSNSSLSFTYILPTSADGRIVSRGDMVDIIAATHRRLYNVNDAVTKTTFTFGHIMSKINLAPAFEDNLLPADDFIEIRKVELSGFKSKAIFNVTPAERQSNSMTDDRVIEVTGRESNATLSIEMNSPVKVGNANGNVSLFGNSDAIIMIPQLFDSRSEAKVVISYNLNNDSEIKQVTLPLVNMEWASGKSYTYKFTISRVGIILDSTSITDWEETNVGNIDAR